jgi:RNA polymerase sigma-70 factor, ECF subfamily
VLRKVHDDGHSKSIAIAQDTCYHRVLPIQGLILATRQEMADFLQAVERRAFKQSMFAVHDEDTALDLVQDAMLRLAESYSHKPAEELPLLFQRILQNGIRDYYRRSRTRSTWSILLSDLGFRRGEEEEVDPLDTMEIEDTGSIPIDPSAQVQQTEVMANIEKAVADLPARQREAFMLRYWEELDVSETAKVMGCTEGSVKTHCSRATHTLAKVLAAKGITL